MHSDTGAMSADDESKLRRANVRMALLLAAIAVGVLVAFIWSVTASGGSVA